VAQPLELGRRTLRPDPETGRAAHTMNLLTSRHD